MEWWVWFILGLMLLVGEVISPGAFFLLFFGIAALIVSLLTGISLLDSPTTEWILFSFLSVVTLLLFRNKLKRAVVKGETMLEVDSMIGESAIVVSSMEPGARGTVELRGTQWGAVNTGSVFVLAGQEVKVISRDGLALLVR